MQDKSTMSIYRKFKHTIRDEQDLYDTTVSSVTMFRARTDTLSRTGKEGIQMGTPCVTCMCTMNLIEHLHHFLMECPVITAFTDTIKKHTWTEQ